MPRAGASFRGSAPWVAAAAAALATCSAGAAEASACAGLDRLESVGQVTSCAEELLEVATEAQHKSLKKCLGALKDTREACGASLEQATGWGCKALSDLSYELFAEGASLLHTCKTGPAEACDERGRVAALAELSAWQVTENRFRNTPAESMVTSHLAKLRGELLSLLMREERLGEGEDAMPAAWQVAVQAVNKFKHWVSGYIWRETHWLWLQDSLLAGKVVQTAWGDAEEWLRFGVHDAYAEAPLSRFGPRYTFSEHLGMRWELFVDLLKDLHKRRGGQGPLQVVEVGVFAGHLSQILLRDCDFIHLLGIDPYVGRDGTFPGNFSNTLDADVALYKAASVIEPHGERAQLWPVTSAEAVADIQDGSVDAIFIDGCHLYDCVRQDLELWLPKMRRGVETLVAGHDFSPQWPGVVQAVHEQRSGGQEVTLASDWMYWWFEQYE